MKNPEEAFRRQRAEGLTELTVGLRRGWWGEPVKGQNLAAGC